MKKELLKHIEILKTVPEIKKDIEELKMFTRVELKDFKEGTSGSEYITNIVAINYFEKKTPDRYKGKETNYYIGHPFHGWREGLSKKELLKKCNIIGQVEERHLRMFLKSKCNDFTMFKYPIWYNQKWVELETEKPYMEQSEEFFKKLNDWLISEFNIKLDIT